MVYSKSFLPKKSAIIPSFLIALILPLVFLMVAYWFRKDIKWDMQDVGEELAKSVLALVVSIIGILIANILNKAELERKARAACHITSLQFNNCKGLINEITNGPDLLSNDKRLHSKPHDIRKDENNQKEKTRLCMLLRPQLLQMQDTLLSLEPDVSSKCLGQLKLLNKSILKLNQYIEQPSSDSYAGLYLSLKQLKTQSSENGTH